MNKRLPSEGFGGLTFTCHDGLQMRISFERKNKNRAAAELSLQRYGHPVTELEDKLGRPVVILPFVSLLTDLAKRRVRRSSQRISRIVQRITKK